VRVDPVSPDPEPIRLAVDTLGKSGVVVFPTSGLYGLGADACNGEAVARIYAIKGRPDHKPILVLINDLRALDRLVRAVPRHAQALMQHLWPGGITLILEAAAGVSEMLTAGTGKIGVRLPAHPVARALVAQFGGAITATSANRSGQPAVAGVDQLDRAVKEGVDLILDAGRLAGGSGSTVLDVTCRPPKILRDGTVSRQAIESVQCD
jgi:L-threonylcarbamoyladenylate synthase